MEHVATISIDDMHKWIHCPKCGSEILEFYAGDFTGHTSCMNDNCEILEFEIVEKEGSQLNSLHPRNDKH